MNPNRKIQLLLRQLKRRVNNSRNPSGQDAAKTKEETDFDSVII